MLPQLLPRLDFECSRLLPDLLPQVLDTDLPLCLDTLSWSIEPLTSFVMVANTAGLYRLKGQVSLAHSKDRRDWSVVLKVLQQTGSGPADCDYWQREALVYQSGLLENLPGNIRTPRCYAITDQLPGQQICLWLEDIAEDFKEALPLPLYAQVAHQLGVFNGAYLAKSTQSGVAVPDYPWLSRHSLQWYTSHFGKHFSAALEKDFWNTSLIQRAFSQPLSGLLQRIDKVRPQAFAALEQLPQTLSHLDAHRDNLIGHFYPNPSASQPNEQVTIIDWAFLGFGAVGQDLAALVGLSLAGYKDLTTDPACLAELSYTHYLKGLAKAGWLAIGPGEAHNERLARAGFVLSMLVRWSCALTRNLGWYLIDGRQEWLEISYKRPIAQVLEAWAAVGYTVLDYFEEAVSLLEELGYY